MKHQKSRKEYGSAGFSAIEAMLIVVVLAAICLGGWYAYHRGHKVGPKSVSSSSQGSTKKTTPPPPADPYAGWKTYVDTGYASASGIIIKYPPTWKIVVDGGPTVGNATNPVAEINLKSVDLSTPQSPMQEWNTCATTISADACGASPGDKTLSGNSTIINGLNAYSATMQSDIGTYYVTVIAGNKAIPSAGIPFDEFTLATSNQTTVDTFRQIMSTATFSN